MNGRFPDHLFFPFFSKIYASAQMFIPVAFISSTWCLVWNSWNTASL